MIFINKRSVSPFNPIQDESDEGSDGGGEEEEAKLRMKVPSDFKSFKYAPNYYKENKENEISQDKKDGMLIVKRLDYNRELRKQYSRQKSRGLFINADNKEP